MLVQRITSKLPIAVLTAALIVWPQLSFADWSIGLGVGEHYDHHHYYRWHDHPHWGMRMHYLPAGSFTVWAEGRRYYYYDGLYYTYVGGGDYVVVAPPVGAVVTSIPPDFQPVRINGETYYVNDGVYYVYTRHGYRVIPQPVVALEPAPMVVAAQPAPVVVAAPAPAASVVVEQDTFPVNIPDDKGGYKTVVVKKSGSGYVGPQGEFYAEFPKVSQLKAMYGK
ncbi:MAG: hypothetical protein HQL13_03115 [Candidatus Omnitrophica bacterium]|nr:hypothetical protein [Candidatus Omnitrophota bacterium]